ncbi:MAG TPA: hypothetical protein PLZ06_06705 [Clostridia bacterium]|nr:MAG: hypothetical protein BWX97_00115 [Firmicutes bacterium ADurb.Bin146]HPY98716.1 hypothetical protein [Clostridia bacterium]HQC68364.1 hypothetical protein [Clostridia bacterium]
MYNQIILICVGALISIFATVISKFVDSCINKQGDVIIYRKLVYKKNNIKKLIGIYSQDNDYILVIPLWIEIQNTKKVPIIIRDFSLALYKNGKRIKKMKQVNYQKDNESEDGTEVYYGDNGRYSFLISPESIRSFDLLFVLKKSECSSDFDEVKIVYYNQKNKMTIKNLKKIEDSWSIKQFEIDEDWVEIY